jgi:hypothetical protein
MSGFSDLIAGATFRSDLQNSNRVLQAEWIALVNAAITSFWNVIAASRPDFQVARSNPDYTVASGPSASFQVPADFHSIIDVVYGPDTSLEYSLGPFNWQNRRSPGGWFWPVITGYGAGQGATGMRLMGWNVFLEPSINAGGTYRLWYCPKPHIVVQTVRLATVGALPACTAAGSGPGKTLTASANGALAVDGQTVNVGNLILVKNQATSADDGVYIATEPGGASSPFVLTRNPGYDTTGTIFGGIQQGDVVGVGQSDAAQPTGTQEGQFFTLTAFTAIESAQTWTVGAAIDPVLEMFVEALDLKITIPALHRDNRGATAAPFEIRLNGQDGKTGLMGEAKWYFAQNRGATISKLIDTDAQLFRGGFNGGSW